MRASLPGNEPCWKYTIHLIHNCEVNNLASGAKFDFYIRICYPEKQINEIDVLIEINPKNERDSR